MAYAYVDGIHFGVMTTKVVVRFCTGHRLQVHAKLARDVRPVPIKLVSVGKGNSAGASLMAEEWLAKLRRYTTVTEIQLKPNPKKSTVPEIQMSTEAEKVLKALAARDFVVILDERGRSITSEGVAELIAAAGDAGTPLAFCVGGPYGHGEAVRSRANDCISLSRLVLNHQVAYIVLVEQLYRGWTILSGAPYHH